MFTYVRLILLKKMKDSWSGLNKFASDKANTCSLYFQERYKEILKIIAKDNH